MKFSRKPIIVLVCISFFVEMAGTIEAGKSVYVINDTSISEIQAYKIEGNNPVWQTDYVCESDPGGVIGAVGLTISESEYGKFLFITFEGENEIELVNAKTMEYVDTVEVPDPYETLDLAGIVFDHDKQKLYAINRESEQLCVYSWNPITKTLTPDLPSPYYVELQDCYEGYGLALDEENGLLYVADNTTNIKYYKTNDWSKQGQISASCNAIGIAVDVNNQLLYYGSMGSYGEGDPHLYQYDISAQTENAVTVGSSVAGISIDRQTSLVYLTTYEDGDYSTQDRLIIYDPNLVKQPWDSGDIGNPAGVCVPAGDVYYKPQFPTLMLVKEDNIADCVVPGGEITYTITYHANSDSDTNVIITDYLPAGVTYEYAGQVPFDPNYNSNNHTYTWYIGTISPGEVNSVTLTVKVNKLAEPLGTLRNYCEIEGDHYWTYATADTNVCCWNPDVIYVDKDATACANTGMSWKHAYKDLQDALERARNCYADEIWVAEGTYYTHTDPDSQYWNVSFELVDGVSLYGGFAGNETTLSQRNRVKNQTILNGDINGSGESDTDYLITATNLSQQTTIDGFTIKMAAKAGIKIDGGSLTIQNNKIIKSKYYPDPGYEKGYGIECINSASANITNCQIQDNETCGIYCDGGSFIIANCTISANGKVNTISGGGIHNSSCSSLTITHCAFSDNKGKWGGAIYNYSSSPIVINCIFSDNTATNYGGGVYNQQVDSATEFTNCIFYDNEAQWRGGGMVNDSASPTIINCTFSRNSAGLGGGGIHNYLSSSNPVIKNCILWGNIADTGVDHQIENYQSQPNPTVRYCDIQGDTIYPGIGNIKTDPCFVDADASNYHLDANSLCIDRGDPDFNPDPNETDIDGEHRIVNIRVDMGADEYYWSPADFNRDGFVDFLDYAIFAFAWRTQAGDAAYNEDCDLEDNNSVDYADLAVFCEDWLWQAGWMKTFIYCYSQSMAGSTADMKSMNSELQQTTAKPYAAKAPATPAKQLQPQVKQLNI